MGEQAFSILQATYVIVLPVIMTGLTKWFSERNIISKNGKKADCLLLRLALINIHDQAMKDGYINQHTYQEFEDIWKLYHEGYKGNTLTDRFHEEIGQLPLR